jgi:hypothetical protein
MSVKAMAWAWECGATGSDLLTLLAVADCANHDGTNAYPRVAELERKTGLSERTVRSCLQRLRRAGLIDWEQGERKHGHQAPNVYRLTMGEGAITAPCQPATIAPCEGADSAAPGCNSRHVQGATAAPSIEDEPSIEPSGNRRAPARETGSPTLGDGSLDVLHLPRPGETDWRQRVIVVYRATHGGRDPVTSMRAPWEGAARELERGGYSPTLIEDCLRDALQNGRRHFALAELVAARTVETHPVTPVRPRVELPPEPVTPEELDALNAAQAASIRATVALPR